MQIYTKILIGMAVGVLIGLTLGPKSSFLTPDLYTVPSSENPPLFLDRTDPASQIRFPASVAEEVRFVASAAPLERESKGTPMG